MKKKKIILYVILVVSFIVVVSGITISILNNENKLTSAERAWISENVNNVQNIYVAKEANIFSKNGEGVFYTFLNDFSSEYDIRLNIATMEDETTNNEISLNYSKTLQDNSDLFYTDHYVLLGTENKLINSTLELEGINVGLLKNDSEYIKSYLKDSTIVFKEYEKEEELLKDLGKEIEYIILPRVKYLDTILINNLEILYHFSDINIYYTLNKNDDVLSSILSKYLTKWEENITNEIKREEFKIFTSSMSISDSEIDKFLSIDYSYGFMNNSPYEVIMSGNYGGIIAEYLQEFSEFSGVQFDITKYKSIDKLTSAINKGKIDIYFDFNNNISSKFQETTNGINSSLTIITNKSSDKVINSVYGLFEEEVYVEENTILHDYLKSIGNINIKTYKDNKELFKLNNDDVIIVIDSYIYDYYSTSKLDNYISKYETLIPYKYKFEIDSEYEILYKLLDRYINYLDASIIINNGINSHTETVEKGIILNNLAFYSITIIVLVLVGGFIYYKKSKKIKLRKRIKKDDKIRFIDELTCLKNRAYLSDFLKTWSNNTIYPQTIIVMDLNKLKEINDKYGLEEGDKQIQAAANALIKTQLDNSDLMRSDGNEFVIYTVGYNQKQIINYIHKLNKELKKLPYNFGAEFGYSFIENNLKTVEDALSEATQDMKSKKEKLNRDK